MVGLLALAGEVAADGVTVNNILPGYTRTERLEELIEFLADKEDLTADEVKGRNTWIVWSAGNDRMWDTLGDNSVGALDFGSPLFTQSAYLSGQTTVSAGTATRRR